MTRIILFLILIFSTNNYSQWKPKGDRIKTIWGESLIPTNVLQEYPRPNLKREKWKNLNGLWNYKITNKGDKKPTRYNKKILVPFPLESSLSGIQKRITKNQELWYQLNFRVPKQWKHKQIILHFGAVDWESEVWINNKKVGFNQGGYTPFSFNITPYLKSGKQKLELRVWDPTNDGYQPVGKQVKNPAGIWYSPVSGIWQTVWLEPVEKTYITNLKVSSDIDKSNVIIDTEFSTDVKNYLLEFTIKDNDNIIYKSLKKPVSKQIIKINKPKLWSPESPFLYDLNIKLISNGIVLDDLSSYFGMRKISIKKDINGTRRMVLNNKEYFQLGTLDQGWWPDGLYTAPSDEALKFDIQKTKEYGFNMIRKHVKVEPARWYYHADKIGMLVWQDMPNPARINPPEWQRNKFFDGLELKPNTTVKTNFKMELNKMMDFLHSNPSIVSWVIFNEGWGQFDTIKISNWVKDKDPNRLVNSASGGNHYKVGDITSVHNYPEPKMLFYDPDRTNVLGEFGGIGYAVKNHLWQSDKNWGYIKYLSSDEATNEYVNFSNLLKELVPKGFSAAVYTQITDVEGEVNGLMTYDRKVLKMSQKKIYRANRDVISTLPAKFIKIPPNEGSKSLLP